MNIEEKTRKALDLNSNITFISAVAGAGKTTLIIKRIIKLLINNVNPEKIIVITYTNEAINEITNRLKQKFFDWSVKKDAIFLDLENICDPIFDSLNQFSSYYDFLKKNKLEESFDYKDDFYKTKSSIYVNHEVYIKLKNFFNFSYHEKIQIKTFHSFCFDALKNFSNKFKFTNFKVLTQEADLFLFNSIIENEYYKYDFIEKNISINNLKKIFYEIKSKFLIYGEERNNFLLRLASNFYNNSINFHNFSDQKYKNSKYEWSLWKINFDIDFILRKKNIEKFQSSFSCGIREFFYIKNPAKKINIFSLCIKISKIQQNDINLFDLYEKINTQLNFEKSFFKRNFNIEYIGSIKYIINNIESFFKNLFLNYQENDFKNLYLFELIFNLDRAKYIIEKLNEIIFNSLYSNKLSTIEKNFILFFININQYFSLNSIALEYINLFFTKDFKIKKNIISNDKQDNFSNFISSEILFLKKIIENQIIYSLSLNDQLINFFINVNSMHEEQKKINNFISFDDILKEFLLLIDDSEQKESILYKLSQSLQHIVVDEAQDNSKIQWKILKILTEEIFHEKLSEEGSWKKIFSVESFSEKKDIYKENILINEIICQRKSLFVVGDIKQSIYSFQGASPELFLENIDYYQRKSKKYYINFQYIKWNFCFRVNSKNLYFIDKYFNFNEYLQDLLEKDNLSHEALKINDGNHQSLYFYI